MRMKLGGCCCSLVVVTAVIMLQSAEAAAANSLAGSAAYTYYNNSTLMLLQNRRRDPHESLLHEQRRDRSERNAKRKAAFQERIKKTPPQREDLARVTDEQLRTLRGDRTLGWLSGSGSGVDSVSNGVLADPTQDYDMWAQAYRMLGGFIDCDHDWDQDDHHDNNNNNNNNNDHNGCSRWMMWAAYINPNYQGNGHDEYFGDNPTSSLDCHNPDSDWNLIGVYRQEFYQYIEQISKHIWAIDEYEYVVALAGLSYMSKNQCFYVGADSSGNSIYASIAPQPYGKFTMALYTDDYCLTPDESLGVNYDDFGLQSDIYLGSKDATDDDSKSWAYDWWYDTQEYTLSQLNTVYDEFKYCTSCIDYPTYQDGYFIGDDGTDNDDLINQCWKFHSHDSFVCEADCIAKAHAQGTILSIQYGDTTFGRATSSFYKSADSSSSAAASSVDSPMARLLANAFLTLSFLLFVATFLAFAVARRSRYRESRSSRSRRLLDDDEDGRSRKSRRSSSKAKEGDGVYRTSGSSRGKSTGRKRSGSRNTRRKRRSKSYDPPKDGSPRNEPASDYY